MTKVLRFDAKQAKATPRDLPSYRVSEAAHYLRIPKATLRAWVAGQKNFRPVIRAPHPQGPPLLSFVNLVEAHVLDALRREHHVSLPKIRAALRYLARTVPHSGHPLAELDLRTDGFDVLVDRWGSLVNASRHGQLEMRHVLEAYLRRVERNSQGLPVRLYPFTRKSPHEMSPAEALQEPQHIVIDPAVAFGRPTLAGTGIPTEVIGERYRAGESIDELAEDYDRTREEIEEAVRCEFAVAA